MRELRGSVNRECIRAQIRASRTPAYILSLSAENVQDLYRSAASQSTISPWGHALARYRISVNGQMKTIDADPDTPLLWVLRDNLNLTGTKYGCGQGVCGACSVLEKNEVQRSCQITVAQANGRTFTTIEGLSSDGNHPVQAAWIEEDVSQCGYCQVGMIMNAAALLKKTPRPSDLDIDDAMSNSLCRCGTYLRVRKAIHRAAGDRA
jgi:isoquinoline 1-oxidoreductase alpha subunit